MARVVLAPLLAGTPDDATLERNRANNDVLATRLRERRASVRLGWGEKYQQRTRQRGKMTVWDRVEALADPGTTIRTLGTFVNFGEEFGPEKRTSPSAGVITAIVRVHGRMVMAIANDNTVASGAWWPRTPEKIIRAQEIAQRLRLPVAYLVDCSGLFLP